MKGTHRKKQNSDEEIGKLSVYDEQRRSTPVIPRYKRRELEWKHFVVGDATCERFGNTGDALRTAIQKLRREFTPAGVKINLTETFLDKTRMAESNESG